MGKETTSVVGFMFLGIIILGAIWGFGAYFKILAGIFVIGLFLSVLLNKLEPPTIDWPPSYQ